MFSIKTLRSFCSQNRTLLLLAFSCLLVKPSLPTNFEEDTWATLKSAITAIFLKKPDPCDCEKLYQVIFPDYFLSFWILFWFPFLLE